jgi:4-diphosphocytidyl-2-C-methyl-D-erythritol kinase
VSASAVERLGALAPAKVNLCLYVGARRDDGRHAICSLFQAITLADELRLEPAAGAEDELVCPGVRGVNLAARALAGFRERFGWKAGPVRVTIEKRVPIAAGLGGGSADAGAVLRLASAASGIDPPAQELAELAASLGADVPSQLSPGLALVTGAGEQVEPLEPPPSHLAFVLLTGAASLSTAEVYTKADELGLGERDLDGMATELRGLAARRFELGALAPLMRNDLERAALALEPAVATGLALMNEMGPAAALMSGSGPTVFGVFDSGLAAENARRELAERWPGETVLAASVDSSYAAPLPLDTPSSDRSGAGQ